MKFLFSYSTRHLSHSLRPLVSYWVKDPKRNSLCTHAYVYYSLYHKRKLYGKISGCICSCRYFRRDGRPYMILWLTSMYPYRKKSAKWMWKTNPRRIAIFLPQKTFFKKSLRNEGANYINLKRTIQALIALAWSYSILCAVPG